jgi:ABC-2 type transport system permease protein
MKPTDPLAAPALAATDTVVDAEVVAVAGSNLQATLCALGALLVLTVRQHLHGRRLLVLSLLFAMPGVLAAVVGLASSQTPPAESLQFALVLNLIPHALAPLAALVYAAGVIQDEVEEQTLTYLLLRPLPRPALYLVKLAGVLVVTALLTAVFTMATVVVIALTTHEPVTFDLLGRAMTTAGLLALSQVGYCGLFGLMGLLVRRSLILGVAYIVFLEGVLASVDTVARRLTVMYYYRVLVLRWLDPLSGSDWSIDLATAPEASSCVLVLLGIGLVLATTAAFLFTGREFRMKTPSGG